MGFRRLDRLGRLGRGVFGFTAQHGTVVARLYGVKTAQEVLGHRDAATTLNNYVLPELQAGVTDHLF